MNLWLRTVIEVHKDETPCPANDRESSKPCPLVGTGIHESIEQHLVRAHDTLRSNIDAWRIWRNLPGTQIRHPLLTSEEHQLVMENIHEMMHGRTAPNDLPEEVMP